MKILVIDVGGTHIKVSATSHKTEMKIPSGTYMTAGKMVSAVKKIITGWKYDATTIGYPGPVVHDGHIIGLAGLKRLGNKKWRLYMNDVVERLITALEVDYVVLGGGNSRLIKELPSGARTGDNKNAFRGGYRLWNKII